LIADGALNYVGRMEVVPLDELWPPEKKPKEIIASRRLFGIAPETRIQRIQESIRPDRGGCRLQRIRRRCSDDVAGSVASRRRSGGSFCPEEIYEIVASAAPMEAMVKPVRSYHDLLKQKPDVWAVGPGLGKIAGS